MIINQFQADDQIDEMEALRAIVPSFAKAELEPFLVSAQQDVVPPTWNKLKMPDSVLFGAGDSNSNATAVTVTGCLNGSPAAGVAMYFSPPQNF